MTPERAGNGRDYSRFRPRVSLFGVPEARRPLSLLLLLGSTDISGGTYVILQHLLEAEARGDEVTVVPLFEPTSESTGWHPAFEGLRLATFEEIADEEFDIAVATWWRTIYEFHRVRAQHYAYFVQSIESRFYAADDFETRRLADATYNLPIPVITETPWIQWFLALEHNRPSFLVPNGIEKSLYNPVGPVISPRPTDGMRVLIEGPLGVPMKNVEQAIEVVREVDSVEAWLMTSSDVETIEGVDQVFSRVPITTAPAVYRSCDVLVKLSRVEGMFGPPLEMFHCGGTTICWDVTGQEDYVENGINGLVVASEDLEQTVEAVRYLHKQTFELRRLQLGALETAARWPSWVESSRLFHDALEVIARQESPSHREMLSTIAHTRAAID
jgi:glycosyltransferase involved in cell wall biosynthesis